MQANWSVRLRARRNKRGVSPIIATILLVAITVVLAAVLYVLISGLTSTGARTPYSLGMSETGATTTGGNWIAITVNPTTGLTTGLFGLKVTSSVNSSTVTVGADPGYATTCKPGGVSTYSQTNCAKPTAADSWYAVIVNSNGTVASVFSTSTTPTGWSTTVAVSGAMTIYVISDASSPTLSGGNGFSLSAYSTSSASVSGSVTL